MNSSMFVPAYYDNIVEIIQPSNWLLHNFKSLNLDIYNPVDYQHNRQVEGINYQVVLDMNVLQYLLNVVKRDQSTEHSRIATAYLAFFQIADIQLDPTYAIYEKINYSGENADEAISNLEQFNGINNHSLDELAAYALGYEQKLRVAPMVSDDRAKLKAELLQYKRLNDWDSLYLCVLSITDIYLDTSISHSQKTIKFVEWCIRDFRFSVVALVYACAFFGQRPARKMMKFKLKESQKRKSAALNNMTWDLYYIDKYMKAWASKDTSLERLMLTADKGLALIMQLGIECQHSQGLEPLRSHIGSEVDCVNLAYKNRNSVSRAYQSKDWGYEYRANLISELETKLSLINEK